MHFWHDIQVIDSVHLFIKDFIQQYSMAFHDQTSTKSLYFAKQKVIKFLV